ncbi:hypothetical protein E1A91_A07G070500v1 [Gossypium mustelinum]|uniref:Protease Do-like PDZ domain-containing protein n=1 Tax=Gossypium mustelinum TaxID=34275 RepID=A0A5D2YHM7_GOSMU|nr:hypothetical protein E1A91_A07G070500v1 [Gossypium mustelinum]
MRDTKRKRGRKPKNPTPSQPLQSAVEITTTASRPRGRPKKLPKLPDNPDPLPPPPILSPCRHVSDGTAIGLGGGSGGGELAGDPIAARVVPGMDAVVKVFCIHTEPNFSLPWQRKRQYSSSTTARVKVQKRWSNTKYLATVLCIGTECDIVEFGELPALQDAVTVVGYPIGGDTISVTSGVVSGIEILSYVHRSAELLGLQIDAAINSGNSGGPAFNDKGNCVGIAFQSLKHEDAENIGYVIPTPVIQHFIQDYEKNEAYTGNLIWDSLFWGLSGKKMENPDLRKAMDMKPEQKGVRICRVDPTAPESMVLKSSDIVLSFDGVDIANDGTEGFALNGKPVTNLRRLAEMVENCDDEFLKLDLEYEQTVVLRTKTAKAATPDILATRCIPSAMSADLKALRPWT